jgi:hypothetical protein
MGYETTIHSFRAIEESPDSDQGCGVLRGFALALPISLLLWAGIIGTVAMVFFR